MDIQSEIENCLNSAHAFALNEHEGIRDITLIYHNKTRAKRGILLLKEFLGEYGIMHFYHEEKIVSFVNTKTADAININIQLDFSHLKGVLNNSLTNYFSVSDGSETKSTSMDDRILLSEVIV